MPGWKPAGRGALSVHSDCSAPVVLPGGTVSHAMPTAAVWAITLRWLTPAAQAAERAIDKEVLVSATLEQAWQA